MKKKIIITGTGITVILVAAAIVFFIQNMKTEQLSKQYNVTEAYVKEKKAELKDWDTVQNSLIREKYAFTEDEANKLYAQGYLAEDMQRAQQMGADTGVDKMKILKERGISPKLKDWDTVIKKLKLDVRSNAERYGLSKQEIQDFEGRGYTAAEVTNIALLIKNYKMKVEDINKELKAGKTIDRISAEQLKLMLGQGG